MTPTRCWPGSTPKTAAAWPLAWRSCLGHELDGRSERGAGTVARPAESSYGGLTDADQRAIAQCWRRKIPQRNLIGVGKAAPQELLHREGVETRNAAAISR
jgi:hypothetical protein